MPQISWPAFTGERENRHLIVAEVPTRATAHPATLVRRLIERLQPTGDFALSAQQTADGTEVFCAFAQAADADGMVEALGAQEDNRHPGWASEYRCLIDETSARTIADTVRVEHDS